MTNSIFNKDSIFFTITVTFLVSIILIMISFSVLYKSNEKRESQFNFKRDIDVSKMVIHETRHNGISKELKEHLHEINFSIIDDYTKINTIFKNKNLRLIKSFQKRMINIQHLELNGKSLIYINTPKHNILIENNNENVHHQYTLLIIFVIVLSIFIILYFITINKLKPLKILKNQMKDFANERFDLDCATTKQDEISQLANEFDKTAKKLKMIKESRNIFIRNIMHELKTPITKGKILAQLPQTKDNNDTMQKVFYRLESLISEFNTIEELLSTIKILNTKDYNLTDIIDNSIDILMCEEDEVICEFDNIKVNIDFKLFSIAIKNLLDNGIKYSTNKQVIVKTNNNSLIFENIGEKLVYPIENYFEPFFKGDDVKSNQSFGLGLYIIKHILDAHNYSINYIYENGINRFIVEEKTNK